MFIYAAFSRRHVLKQEFDVPFFYWSFLVGMKDFTIVDEGNLKIIL